MAKFCYEHPDLIREGIIFRANKEPDSEPVEPVANLPEPEPEPEPNPKITGTCQYCGNPLKTTKQKRYCSDSCRYHAELERRRELYKVELEGVTTICENCGKEFSFASGRTKYCCRECYLEKARKRNRKQTSTQEKKCVVCGEKFQTFYWNKMTCSTGCAKEWKKMYDRAKGRKKVDNG